MNARWVRRTASLAAIAVASMTLQLTPGAAAPPAPVGAPAGAPVPNESHVTLVTGDVVALATEQGRQTARVVTDAPPLGDVTFAKLDDDLYAFPGAAIRMLAGNQLDRRLFNLSLLVRDGFADRQAKTLPVIVSYRSDKAATKATLGGAKVERRLRSIKGVTADVTRDRSATFFDSVTDAAKGPHGQLNAKPDVAKIWLDGKVRANLDVSRVTVGADRAAAAGFDGTGTTIAILDTGMDEAHPDLAGKVVAKRSFVPDSDPEDVHDGYGHGTHVASIAAGTGAASDGRYKGIAPGAKLAIGKVLDDTGHGEDSTVIAGMEWAASQAKVVNISLGGGTTDGTDPLSLALNEISRRTGALFVVAAGNAETPLSVASPGSADEALTVGAVSKDGSAVTTFSSKGPRFGDWALKPEISAPGLGIVAARAGTQEYVAFDGTSMATPHVAGAAAILVGQHPDWTRQQVKDALTSTSKPNADPIWWQGSGVMDVGTAVTRQLRATGVVDLGEAPFPLPAGATLSGTTTFRNDGDQPVTLDLASSWWSAPRTFTDAQTPWQPPAGAVRIEPARVTVPAGGTATAKVTVDLATAALGATFGRVTGTAADGGSVHTTLRFVREAERHRLELPATDRAGIPVHSTTFSYGFLQNLDSGEVSFVFWNQGKAVFSTSDGRQDLLVGRYSFVGWIGDFGEEPVFPLRSWTFVAEPQIELDRDRTYVLDIRKAGPLELTPRRRSFQHEGFTLFTRTSPAGTLSVWPQELGYGVMPDTGVNYLLGSRTSASVGTFRMDKLSYLVAPPVTLTASSRTLIARYAASRQCYTEGAAVAPCVPHLSGTVKGKLVDVGDGTQEAVDQAVAKHGSLRGRYVLMRPVGTATGIPGLNAWLPIDKEAAALAAAGVAGVVVAPPIDGVSVYYEGKAVGPPMSVLSVQDGRWLRSEVAKGRSSVELLNGFPSPYRYNLWVTRTGKLPNGVAYHPHDGELGRVDVRNNGDTPADWQTAYSLPPYIGTMGLGGFAEWIKTPFTRTEYYSPGIAWPATGTTSPNRVQGESVYAKVWRRGERLKQTFGSGPWVPGEYLGWSAFYRDGVLVRQDDSFAIRLAQFTAPGPYVDDYRQEASWTFTGDTRCVSGCAEELAHNASRLDGFLAGDTVKFVNEVKLLYPDDVSSGYLPPRLSTQTRTEWTVHTKRPAAGSKVEQPVVLLDWAVETGLDNVVAPHRHRVTLTPTYPTRHVGSHGRFAVDLWATYDDGATWVKVGSRSGIAKDSAVGLNVGATPATTNGYVGYRAVVTDAAGNRIDQTVLRAARTR